MTTTMPLNPIAATAPTARNHKPRSVEERCALASRLSAAPGLEFVQLTVDEVALLAGTNVRKIEALCQSGKGPTQIRLGYRTVRFNAAEVVRWLHGQTQRSNPL